MILPRRRGTQLAAFLLACTKSATTYAFAPGLSSARLRSRQSSCTSLSAIPRDPKRSRRPGDSDEEREAMAAAEAVRRQLERMWSSSPPAGDDDHVESTVGADVRAVGGAAVDDLTAEEAKLQEELDKRLEEDHRENPFPTSSERGALEASRAAQQALAAGMRGLIIDVEVMQMDDQHPEYDPDLFIHFVGEVSKNLATMAGRTKVMYKGNTMAAKAMMALQKDNEEDVRRGFDPRDDIEFCSFLAPTFSRDEIMNGGIDADRGLEKFSRIAAAQFGEDDRLLVVAGPRTPTDVKVLVKVIGAAKGRPIVVINPKVSHKPREMARYETVYQLRQFKVIPIKVDPRESAARSPFAISAEQRKQTYVTCELGAVVPRVLMARSYPDGFKLYIDLDGLGFKLMETYDRLPMIPIVCLKAQMMVGQYQREQTQRRVSEEHRRWSNDAPTEDEEADDDEDGRHVNNPSLRD